MTAMVDKTSHKNKHLRNDDYFAIIAFCSHFILLTNYAKNEPVRAEFNVENERFTVVCSRCH